MQRCAPSSLLRRVVFFQLSQRAPSAVPSPLLHRRLELSDDELGDTPRHFLDALPGALEIFQEGRDRGRYRVAVALLHGNEPSGLVAIHRWLRSRRRPAVDTSLFVVAVEAAQRAPGLAFRMPPGRRDLNRCFGDASPIQDAGGVDRDAALARALLARIRHRPCEALVDLHNNTGRNPSYGVLTRPTQAHIGLVTLFAEITCLLAALSLGTLLEAIDEAFPAVSIECGQAHTEAADQVASEGLRRFLERDQLPRTPSLATHRFFEEPVRVCLRPGTRVAFADRPIASVELTLRPDIEAHNFQRPAAGTLIGWLAADAPWPFLSQQRAGRDLTRDCFARDGEALRWRGELVPIMMTTDARVAFADCLCYLMHQRDQLPPDPDRDDQGGLLA